MVFLQCPYCKKDVSVSEAAEDTQFCLEELTEGGYQLKRTHAYFYQVCVCFAALLNICITACSMLKPGSVSAVLHWKNLLRFCGLDKK